MSDLLVDATNKAFYEKHPERKGQPLQKGEPDFDALSKEWNSLKNDIARKQSEQNLSQSKAVAGQAKQDCPTESPPPAIQEPEQKVEPCDFKSFKIQCSHDGRSVKYTKGPNGEVQHDLPPLPAKSKRQRDPFVFEVVAKPAEAKTGEWGPTEKQVLGQLISGPDKLTVTLEKDPSCCQKLTHPYLSVWDNRKGAFVQNKKGVATISFDVAAAAYFPNVADLVPIPGIAPAIIKMVSYLWFDKLRVRNYYVRADACPFRPKGDYPKGLGDFSLPVVVYPSDKYEMKINLKPAYKRTKKVESTTGKLYGPDKGTTYNSTTTSTEKGLSEQASTKDEKTVLLTTSPDGTKTTKTETTKTNFTSGTTVKTKEKVKQPDGASATTKSTEKDKKSKEDGYLEYGQKNFELKRNGQPLYKPIQDDDLLGTVLGWVDTIQKTLEFVKKLGSITPKVGYWVDMSFEVLSGSVSATWEYAERKDNTVYRKWEVSLGLNLFSGNIKLHYGLKISFASQDAQASIWVSAALGISANGSFKSNPDDDAGDSTEGKEVGSVTGTLTISVGITGAVNGEDIIGGDMQQPLVASGKVYVGGTNPFQLKVFLKRDPLVLTLYFKAKWLASFEKKIELLKGSDPDNKNPALQWPHNSPRCTTALPDPVAGAAVSGAKGSW